MQNYQRFTSLNMDRSDLPVVICPLIVYSDDTSGNRSKKWNKFDYWCILLAGLPRHENSKLSNIHFIGCSNRANCMEISAPIVGDLLLLEQRGIVTYDALLGKQVKLLSVYSIMYRQFNTGKINCTCHDAHWRQSKSIRVPQPHGFNC